MNKLYALLTPLLFVVAGLVTGCALGEALKAAAESPEGQEALGEATAVVVQGVASGQGAGSVLTQVGSILGPLLAAAALAFIRGEKKKPSRAAIEVATLQAEVKRLTDQAFQK